ncbi:hypothetical protein [Psychromonas sp. L1A2]|uniref:hypothetical protein n=1 Tax=Psychromonas sp. L1A2 TaxID=2686356 RepID=UPI00135C45BB|nr:hypothetical protein [Psychromonas sp. L1A2]
MDINIIQLTTAASIIISTVLFVGIYTITRLNILQKDVAEQANLKFLELENRHETHSLQLKSLLEKQHEQLIIVKRSYVGLKKVNNEQLSQTEEHFKNINKYSAENLDKLNAINKQNNIELINKLIESEKLSLTTMSKIHKQLISEIQGSKSDLVKELQKNIFINKQAQISLKEQIASNVQSMKIENAIDLTNKLTEGRDLKVETKDFIKHLGGCKVTKIEDKAANQKTEIIYKDGLKVASETYANNKLKYIMSYDKNGKLSKGEEFCDQGKLAFEYQYNEAGEVSKRIDH